jgi:hypothetical protein
MADKKSFIEQQNEAGDAAREAAKKSGDKSK